MRVGALFVQLTKGCGDARCENREFCCAGQGALEPLPPNVAAARAMQEASASIQSGTSHMFCSEVRTMAKPAACARYVVALSLAEGETVRRVIHAGHAVLRKAAVAVRSIAGDVLDASPLFFEEPAPAAAAAASGAVGEDGSAAAAPVRSCMLCLRFFNCDMYYSDEELEALEAALAACALADRRAFFAEALRLRRRERNLWEDTPVAKLFTPRAEWGALRARAKLQQLRAAVLRAVRQRKVDPVGAFARADAAGGGGGLAYEAVERVLASLHLGFAPRTLQELVREVDADGSGRVSMAQYRAALQLPSDAELAEMLREEEPAVAADAAPSGAWQCSNCTYMNAVTSATCAMCELGWTGRREVPPGKWVCAGEKGGCTFFNANTEYYCEVCHRARPDLASTRF